MTTKKTTKAKSASTRKKKVLKLSASMIKTFNQCRRKFEEVYVLGNRSQGSDATGLGSSFHAGVEYVNKLRLEEGLSEMTEEIVEAAKDVYRETAIKVNIQERAAFDEGLNLLERYLWEMDLEPKVVGVELEFPEDFTTEEGVPLRGFIDLVEEVDEDTIRVRDYKTSRVPISWEEAQTDVQLSMYNEFVTSFFPQYSNVLLELDFVRLGKTVPSKRNSIQRSNFRKELVIYYKQIQDFIKKQSKKAATREKGFLNSYCGWCEARTSCPQYMVLLENHSPLKEPVQNMEFTSLREEYENNDFVMKAFKERNANIKLWLLQNLEFSEEVLRDEEKEVSIRQNSRREIDPLVVLKNFKIKDLLGDETGEPIITIRNKGLEAYFKNNPDPALQEKIDQQTEVKWNNPSVGFRKAK